MQRPSYKNRTVSCFSAFGPQFESNIGSYLTMLSGQLMPILQVLAEGHTKGFQHRDCPIIMTVLLFNAII